MGHLSTNKGVKGFPVGPGGIRLPRVKRKAPETEEGETPPHAEINPSLLDHEELLPDRKGEDQTKAHRPYEFKSWVKQHLISKWVYWL